MSMQQVPPAMQPHAVPPDVIEFYNRDEPFYEFTNFYPVMIVIDGKEWRSSEHFFQASKFPDHEPIRDAVCAGWSASSYYFQIRQAQTPREAFEVARQYEQYKRRDWEEVKEKIMMTALRHKFKQVSNQ